MIPYCGVPPVPGHLLARWNLDPVLLACLATATSTHLRLLKGPQRSVAAAGWTIATIAFISPICPLSVALFSARIAQHMVLMLIAAPLIGVSIPQGRWRHSIWWSAAAFMGLLGAVLSFSAHPWFAWYRSTTEPWGLSQLQDQQLGGIIMWVPSGVIFLAAATRSFVLMHSWLERAAAH
jgi:putative membrane protein